MHCDHELQHQNAVCPIPNSNDPYNSFRLLSSIIPDCGKYLYCYGLWKSSCLGTCILRISCGSRKKTNIKSQNSEEIIKILYRKVILIPLGKPLELTIFVVAPTDG